MTVQNIECKDSDSYNYAPVYLACFGTKNLPKSLKAKVGPVYSNDPLANCPAFGFPTTQIEITMNLVKTPGCGLTADNFVYWCGDAGGGSAFCLFGDPFVALNASLSDITTTYRVGNSINVAGSCIYDPITGNTHLTVTGILIGEGANLATCYVPFEIFYDGV